MYDTFETVRRNKKCLPTVVAIRKFVLTCVLIISIWMAEFIPVPDTFFIEQDPTLSFPLISPSTIPGAMLKELTILLPIGIICLLVLMPFKQVAYTFIARRNLLFWLLLGFCHVWLFTNLMFTTMKRMTGRLRPNFFAICDYQYYHTNYQLYLNLTKAGTIGKYGNCMAPPNRITYAKVSFPSNHSGFGFASMSYLMYVLRFIANINQNKWLTFSSVFAWLPLFFAGWIALTRVTDSFHHVDDVIASALFGFGISTLIWKNFYHFHLRHLQEEPDAETKPLFQSE
jgi:membrane-associated phospholipid phosphatase